MVEEKRIVAKAVRPEEKPLAKREMWAMVCYHYPQYTLKEASQLSVRDIKLLMSTAEKIEAKKMFYLTQIASAPHTEKGKGVKQLLDYFERKLN